MGSSQKHWPLAVLIKTSVIFNVYIDHVSFGWKVAPVGVQVGEFVG